MSVIVLQSCTEWLPVTQNWMYHHISRLPEDIEPHIICYKTNNIDSFSLPHIHDLSHSSGITHIIYRLVSKFGIPVGPLYISRQGKRLRSQVLHSHFGNIGWENIQAAAKLKIKHIVTFYGFDVNWLPVTEPLWHGRYANLFASVDMVLCEGHFMKEDIVRLGCPRDKILVQHLGVDVDNIEFRPRTWNGQERLKILIAATFQEKKGIPYALEALETLKDEIDFEVTIIGDANNEEKSCREKERIVSIIKKTGLKSRIKFLSFQPHHVLLEEAYKNHIFLSPSVTADDGDTEGGLPVAILEMAATGMPIVSSVHCDIPEAIHHGQTGLLSRERDIEEISENIRWLIHNPLRWRPMVEAGRKHIENEYNVNTQAARLGSIYRNLVTHNGK